MRTGNQIKKKIYPLTMTLGTASVALFMVLFPLLCLFPIPAHSAPLVETHPDGSSISPTQTVAGYWGPGVITANDNIIIEADITILPNTTIYVTNGAGITVTGSGSLQTAGPVRVTNRSASSGSWSGLTYANGSHGSLNQTTIEYAEHGLTLDNQTHPISLTNSTIRYNRHAPSTGPAFGAGILIARGDHLITNTLIQHNVVSSTDDIAYGGGIAIVNGSSQIINSRIENNIVETEANQYASGGGIAIVGDDAPRLEGNDIVNNRLFALATTFPNSATIGRYAAGGGIAVVGPSDATLRENYIAGNENYAGYASGGAISLVRGRASNRHLFIENNVLYNNVARSPGTTVSGGAARFAVGGGIHLWLKSNATIRNNLIYSNTARCEIQCRIYSLLNSAGGGVYLGDFSDSSQAFYFINNTVVNNRANLGGGIAYESTGQMSVVNNIVANNRTDLGSSGAIYQTFANISRSTDPASVVENNLMWNNNGNNFVFSRGSLPSSNLQVDPLFIGSGSLTEQFHLQRTSPAIAAGNTNARTYNLPHRDYDDEARPGLNGWDIGFDEIPTVLIAHKSVAPSPSGRFIVGERLTYTIRLTNGGQLSLSTMMTDIIPTNTTYQAGPTCSLGSCGYNGGAITWNLTLSAATTARLTFGVDTNAGLAAGTVITNQADIAVGNRITETNRAVVTLHEPTLELSKTVVTPNPMRGLPITYQIRLTNPHATTSMADIVLTETVPAAVNLISTSSGATRVNGDTIRWTTGSLAAGSSMVETFVVSTCQATIFNQFYGATANTPPTSIAGTPHRLNLASPTLAANFVQQPASATVGTPITFTDTSTTNGPNLVSWLWNFGDGITATGRTVSHVYTTAQTYTVNLTVIDACGVADSRAISLPIQTAPSLRVDNQVQPLSATVGDVVTYTYAITNLSQHPISGLQAVDDKLGLVPLNQTTLISNGVSRAVMTYTIITADLPGPLTNTVLATGTVSGRLITGTAQAAVAVSPVGLSLAKTVTPAVDAPFHGLVTYTLSLTNRVAATVNNVIVADPLPSQTRFASWIQRPVGATVGSNNRLDWSGSVTANQQIDFIFAVTHTGNYSDEVVNQAEYRHASGSGTATATFTVEANLLPVAVDDTASTLEDTAVLIDVLRNDFDGNGNDTITINTTTNPTAGRVTRNPNGTITYTPQADFHGVDRFTYRLQDDGGGLSNVATVTITVTAVNDIPVANDDRASLTKNSTAIINVLANDVLGNNPAVGDQPITIILGAASHGTVLLNGNQTVRYTPDFNYVGQDSFRYTVIDGNGDRSSATVNVTMINHPPVANDDRYTTVPNTSLVISPPGILANDHDADGDTITPTVTALPLSGTLSLNLDGSFEYRPHPGYEGTDRFIYHLTDGVTSSNRATVTLMVQTPVDPNFIAHDDRYSTYEDTPLTVPVTQTLTLNDINPAGGVLTTTLMRGTRQGSLTLFTDGSFRYTPLPDYVGEDSFIYLVRNQVGNIATATVTIVVRQAVDLTVSKRSQLLPAVPGRTVTYTLVFTNDGPSNITQTTVMDVFPAELINPIWQCIDYTVGATCQTDPVTNSRQLEDLVDIPAGGMVRYTVIALIDPTAQGTVVNRATIKAPNHTVDLDTTNNQAIHLLPLQPYVDLQIRHQITPARTAQGQQSVGLLPGQWLTYTIEYSNAGPSLARQVWLTETLPRWLIDITCVASTRSGGRSESPCNRFFLAEQADLTADPLSPTATMGYRWQSVDLPPHEGGLITLTGRINPDFPQDAIISTTAEISSPLLVDYRTISQTLLTNTLAFTDRIIELNRFDNHEVVTTTVRLPRAAFTHRAYTVSEADGQAMIPVILDVAPRVTTTVSYLTADGTATAGLDYTALNGVLIFPPATTVLTVTIPILQDNVLEPPETVNLTLQSQTRALLTTPATATLTILDYWPALTLTQRVNTEVAEVGQTITYTYMVTNFGNTPLTDLLLVNPTSGQIYHTQPTLTAGASISGQIRYTPVISDLLGPLTHTIIVTGVPPQSAPLTATATVTVELEARVTATPTLTADLAVALFDTPDPLASGNPLTYTLIITNNGPDPAFDLRLTHTLPMSVRLTSRLDRACRGSRVITCHLASLMPHSTYTLTLSTEPTRTGVITSMATLVASGYDPITANNRAVATTTVGVVDLAISIMSQANRLTDRRPNVGESQRPGLDGYRAPVQVGTPISYTIVVTNRGDLVAYNAILTSYLSSNVPWMVIDEAVCQDRHPAICTLGDLDPQAVITLTFVAVPNRPGNWIHTTQVDSPLIEFTRDNNQATVEDKVIGDDPTKGQPIYLPILFGPPKQPTVIHLPLIRHAAP